MSKKNTVLRAQARKIIHNVTQFMMKEKEEGVKNLNAVQLRAANATGTSQRTVRRILTEVKKSAQTPVFRTPGKKRPRAKPITGVKNFDRGIIKRCIHNFQKTENEFPTIKKLLAKLEHELNFHGSASSLRQIVKDLGFKWKRTESNKSVLIEKLYVRLKRIEYLQNLKKYRYEGRPIVYIAQSFVHSNKGKSWSDGSEHELKHSSMSKEQKVSIVHAGSEDGFVSSALLVIKSADTQNDVNYEKWLRTKLIPNLSMNSVIVLGSTPFHNNLVNPSPSGNATKADMELWLKQKGIPYDNGMFKPQLYKLIQENKDKLKTYSVDTVFAEANFLVQRLPPYHPDLNPTELAWAEVKEYVESKNVNSNINRIMELVQEKVDSMGWREWQALCKKVIAAEEAYRESDRNIDEMTDQVTIIGTGDISESDSDSDSDAS